MWRRISCESREGRRPKSWKGYHDVLHDTDFGSTQKSGAVAISFDGRVPDAFSALSAFISCLADHSSGERLARWHVHQEFGHTEVEAKALAHQISCHRDVLADFEVQLLNTIARIEAVSIYDLDASVTANNASARELQLDTLQGRGPKDPISLCVEREGTQGPRGAATPYQKPTRPASEVVRDPLPGRRPKDRPRAATRKPTKRRSLGLVSPRLDHSVVTGLNKSPGHARGVLPPVTLTAARSLDNAARALDSLTRKGWDPSATLTPARGADNAVKRCSPRREAWTALGPIFGCPLTPHVCARR